VGKTDEKGAPGAEKESMPYIKKRFQKETLRYQYWGTNFNRPEDGTPSTERGRSGATG